MEQTVTCISEISHKPQQDNDTWCKRRLDPSFPFPLFLPPSVWADVSAGEGGLDTGGQCLL